MKKIIAIFMLLLSLVLVACTEPTVYKIEFETNGGQVIESIEFSDKYALNEIDKINPDKAGYSFDGWYLESSLNVDSKLNEDITTSVKLYAKWLAVDYLLTLNLDGGVAHIDQVYTFNITTEVDLLVPTKSNHTFLGWTKTLGDTTYVTKVPTGTASNQAFYANWVEDTVETFNIVFKNHDGTVLVQSNVLSGVLPVYTGQTPTKSATSTHTYEFKGWDKEIVVATAHTEYVALFEEVLIPTPEIDPALLNQVHGFDVYKLLPKIYSDDYELLDFSNESYNDVYIDLFDWNESDLEAYEALLIELFDFDEEEGAYILQDLYIFLYADDEIIEGSIVYGINIYEYIGEEPTEPTVPEGAPFDKDELNGIFEFDIYALMPNITSDNVIITDDSDEDMVLVHVNIFTWSEDDALVYMDLIVDDFEYDALEDAYILGSYFFYVFIDDETYAGIDVFGIAIYGYKDGGEEPTEPTVPEGVPFDKDELNGIFEFDIYALMPDFTSDNVIITDMSDSEGIFVYIDIFTWSLDDADAYDVLLDELLELDDTGQDYTLGDYFIYVFYDDENYGELIVYGIAIYKYFDEEPTEPTIPEGEPFDKDVLNGIFEFDIYALMPSITSDNVLIIDDSDEELTVAYVDIFTWSENDANDYIGLIEAGFEYDEFEEAYILGNYFFYVYIDEEEYPGLTVFGIAIYGYKDGGEEPTEPVDGVYYSFNIQNTTTTLPGSYKDSIDQTLNFTDNNGKVIVKASHVANITGSAPGGLSNGMIFAANVGGNANPTVYLEIDAISAVISSMTFEIQARNQFANTLKAATLQVFTNGVWVDLAGGDFYSQISTNKVTITISNINATKFRLLFKGTGAASNGGQFMISQVTLNQTGSQAPTHELWSDVVSDLEAKFDDLDFNTYMPEFEGLSDLSVKKSSDNEYKVTSKTVGSVATYVTQLLAKEFVKDDNLSLVRGTDVYVYVVNDDLAYGIFFIENGSQVDIVIFAYDAVLDDIVLETLTARQSITGYELAKFGASGLPSTGIYDVLVIPIEIKNAPFDAQYLSKLETVFNGTSQDTGWESVASYYYKSSFGKLDLNFDVVEKHTTQNNKSYYEQIGDDGDQAAMLEALNALDSSIDFSKYDHNNDGVIDSIIFIYSADYDYDIDPWWAWVFTAQAGSSYQFNDYDGLDVEYYMWASYTFIEDSLPGYESLILNSETYVHELGHLLGLEDYYHTSGYGPLGGFDMMDSNVGDHGPFNKLVLGWLEPLVAVKGSYEVTLDSYSLDDDAVNNTLLIPYKASDLDDGNAFDEYLLVVFFTPGGLYNAHGNLVTVPEHAGILVYHVDARLKSNTNLWGGYFRNDSDGTSNFLVNILEADKNNSIPGDDAISQTDLLTAGTLNLNSYKWNQGGNINVSITITSPFNNNSENVTIQVTVA